MFDVLAYLVVNRERVVTKEELLDNVSGDRFVSESALTSRIKSARRAVEDNGQSQHVFRTERCVPQRPSSGGRLSRRPIKISVRRGSDPIEDRVENRDVARRRHALGIQNGFERQPFHEHDQFVGDFVRRSSAAARAVL